MGCRFDHSCSSDKPGQAQRPALQAIPALLLGRRGVVSAIPTGPLNRGKLRDRRSKPSPRFFSVGGVSFRPFLLVRQTGASSETGAPSRPRASSRSVGCRFDRSYWSANPGQAQRPALQAVPALPLGRWGVVSAIPTGPPTRGKLRDRRSKPSPRFLSVGGVPFRPFLLVRQPGASSETGAPSRPRASSRSAGCRFDHSCSSDKPGQAQRPALQAVPALLLGRRGVVSAIPARPINRGKLRDRRSRTDGA